MKKVLVIGLGNFGSTVARQLASLKTNVTAVDSDEEKVRALADKVDTSIVGDASDREFLDNLGVKDFDVVVVSTGEDSQVSILITLYLKECEAKRVIVKANSRDHAKVLQKVGASETVIPEQQMALRLADSIGQPNLIDHLPLSGDFYVVEMKARKEFIDKKLTELQFRSRYKAQIIAIRDTEDGDFNLVPGGDYRIKESDTLVLLGRDEDIEKIQELE